jgi:hypothetical protein
VPLEVGEFLPVSCKLWGMEQARSKQRVEESTSASLSLSLSPSLPPLLLTFSTSWFSDNCASSRCRASMTPAISVASQHKTTQQHL